jgi:hypothetical protein
MHKLRSLMVSSMNELSRYVKLGGICASVRGEASVTSWFPAMKSLWGWLGVEPGEGVITFVVYARLGEVTCVDENVAFWEMRLSVMGVVCVGYANNVDGGMSGVPEVEEGAA